MAGVRVRHPDRRGDALELPELRVRAGELVALAGASGAGKTTALRVLAGVQPVRAGTVEVSGPPPLYLPQRPTLPHARTVAEGLALDGESRPADADAFAALRLVGMDGEIRRSAQGLETPLGEHGSGLSSGQRQRLALARLLRQAQSQQTVLLLDEPTAHLDPAAERLVIRHLRDSAATGCAVLVVAHRPALLAAADRIVHLRRPATGPAMPTIDAAAAAAPVPSHRVPGPPVPGPPVPGPPLPVPPVQAGLSTAVREPVPGTCAPAALDSGTSATAIPRPANPATATPDVDTATPAVSVPAATTPDAATIPDTTATTPDDTTATTPEGAATAPDPASPTTPDTTATGRDATTATTPDTSTTTTPDPAATAPDAAATNPETMTATTPDAWAVRNSLAMAARRPTAAASVAAQEVGGPTDGRPSRTGRLAAALARRWETSVALGAAAWLAGVALTAAAGWLLTRASTLPPVLTLSAAVVVVRASAVARPLLRYLERLASHEVAFTRLGQWRAQVYAGLAPRVPGAFGRRRGELLTRVVDDVDARVDGLLRGRLPAASAVVVLGVATLWASLLVADVGPVLLAGLAVTAILAPAVAARHAARFDADTARARAELRDAVVETVDGLDELGGRPAALAVPDRRSRALSVLEARAARVAGAAAALAQAGCGAAVVGTGAVLGGGTTPPEVAAMLLLGVVALAEPALALPDAAVAHRRAAAARDRLASVAAPPAPTPPSRRTSDAPGPAPRTTGLARRTSNAPGPAPRTTGLARRTSDAPGPAPRTTGLAIRGLGAGWDPDRPLVLSGLDLTVPAGARIAVRGPSGSGKSTLAAVLVGLLEPRAGIVSVAGTDLRAVPATEVHRRVCLVGDDVDHVFASTVRENLRLARPAATDDELRAVLDRARLRDWLDALPLGLDTWLGAGGTTVSGGERRRLAVARALLADPDVLVLDEPTEGLDEATASALMADLLDETTGRAVLLFTHRRDGLDRVDEVYDLTGGRLRPGRVPVNSPA